MARYKLFLFDHHIAFLRRTDNLDIVGNPSALPYFCAIFATDNDHIMNWAGFCNSPSKVDGVQLFECSHGDGWILHCVHSIEEDDIHKLPSWFLDEYEQEIVLEKLME